MSRFSQSPCPQSQLRLRFSIFVFVGSYLDRSISPSSSSSASTLTYGFNFGPSGPAPLIPSMFGRPGNPTGVVLSACKVGCLDGVVLPRSPDADILEVGMFRLTGLLRVRVGLVSASF